MEDIVAVGVELVNEKKRYFLTWGRIQDNVDSTFLEDIVFKNATRWDLGGVPKRARLCATLQEAADQPYFYEALFMMCQKPIPTGVRSYQRWKKKIDRLMRIGKELYYCGNPEKAREWYAKTWR